jgi:predicted nucleic acid-binding protein
MSKIFLIEKVYLEESKSIWEEFEEKPIIPKLNKFVQADDIEEAMKKCGAKKSRLPGYAVISGSSAKFKFIELTEQIKPF